MAVRIRIKAAHRIKVQRIMARRIREVRNELQYELQADCSRNDSLRRAVHADPKVHGTSHELAADPRARSSCIPSPTTQAHRALQRHGGLSSGRSRTAAH